MLLSFVLLALAAPSGESAPTAQPASGPVKEKKICRSAAGTGSLFAKTTCRTQSEWDRMAEEGKKSLDQGTNAASQR